MRLILIRHGETYWNETRKFQGFSDPELSPKGWIQAQKLANSLREEQLSMIYSSPLQRARQTAEYISRYHSCPLAVVEELKELNQGQLEGLTVADLQRDYQDFFKKWIAEPESTQLPEGESLGSLQNRAWKAIERIIADHPEDTVAVVAHSFVNLTIICRILGLPLNHFRRLRQDAAAKNLVEFSAKGYVLHYINDTCHLKEVKNQG